MALRAVLMDVQMAVDMAVQVGMNGAAVPVLMGMHMLMTVGMLQINGVFRKKHRTHSHDRQRNIKLYPRTFSQQKQAKGHAEKGRDGVKSAGLCRAQLLLRHNIKIDAESIGDKAEGGGRSDPFQLRERLPQKKCKEQAAHAGKAALDCDNLLRAFVADLLCAVILEPPAHTGAQNKQRPFVEHKRVFPLKAEEDARSCQQGNREPQSFGDDLPKKEQRDDRGRHNLKIAQQRHICGIRPCNPEHQKDGRGNIQHDHCDRIGKLLFCQALLLLCPAEAFPDDAAQHHSEARTEIQESGQHGRSQMPQQQL